MVRDQTERYETGPLFFTQLKHSFHFTASYSLQLFPFIFGFVEKYISLVFLDIRSSEISPSASASCVVRPSRACDRRSFTRSLLGLFSVPACNMAEKLMNKKKNTKLYYSVRSDRTFGRRRDKSPASLLGLRLDLGRFGSRRTLTGSTQTESRNRKIKRFSRYALGSVLGSD